MRLVNPFYNNTKENITYCYNCCRAARDLLTEAGTFSFSFNSAFRILLIARITSALFGIIPDCDEVFNYWEPLHYLQHGTGMQTWEYSPEFGIRTWAYIVVHSIVATLANILATHKVKIDIFNACIKELSMAVYLFRVKLNVCYFICRCKCFIFYV